MLVSHSICWQMLKWDKHYYLWYTIYLHTPFAQQFKNIQFLICKMIFISQESNGDKYGNNNKYAKKYGGYVSLNSCHILIKFLSYFYRNTINDEITILESIRVCKYYIDKIKQSKNKKETEIRSIFTIIVLYKTMRELHCF